MITVILTWIQSANCVLRYSIERGISFERHALYSSQKILHVRNDWLAGAPLEPCTLFDGIEAKAKCDTHGLFGSHVLRRCELIECESRTHDIEYLIHVSIAYCNVFVQNRIELAEETNNCAIEFRIERYCSDFSFICVTKWCSFVGSMLKWEHLLWRSAFIVVAREHIENGLWSLLIRTHIDIFAVDEYFAVTDFVVNLRRWYWRNGERRLLRND